MNVWTQRDGTLIDVKEMSDSHIQNTINMLKRNLDADPVYAVVKGSEAKEWISLFEGELSKRKLRRK